MGLGFGMMLVDTWVPAEEREPAMLSWPPSLERCWASPK